MQLYLSNMIEKPNFKRLVDKTYSVKWWGASFLYKVFNGPVSLAWHTSTAALESGTNLTPLID